MLRGGSPRSYSDTVTQLPRGYPMSSHSPLAVAVLLLGAIVVLAQPPRPERVLPGLNQSGFVQLPNQWKLKPAGKHLDLGDFPVNIAIHPTGQFAAVLHAGYREHEVIIVDLNKAKTKIVSRVTIDQAFYGLAWAPDGKQLYASGGEFEVVHVFEFDKGYLKKTRSLDVSRAEEPKLPRVVVGGITVDAAGRELFVASPWGDCIVRVPL